MNLRRLENCSNPQKQQRVVDNMDKILEINKSRNETQGSGLKMKKKRCVANHDRQKRRFKMTKCSDTFKSCFFISLSDNKQNTIIL